MSFLGKNYIFANKQEKFDEFMKVVGVPEDKIEQLLKFAPPIKLVKDGDTYTNITATPEGPQETKFKSGVEFDDVIGAQKTPVKCIYTVEGNTVTQHVTSISNPELGTATYKREYNGDELVLTITYSTWDGEAKRYYTAE